MPNNSKLMLDKDLATNKTQLNIKLNLEKPFLSKRLFCPLVDGFLISYPTYNIRVKGHYYWVVHLAQIS